MKYALVLVMIVVASVCANAERLTGQDWIQMTEQEKTAYVAGYLDGRVSEVSNVVVLGIQLSSGGRMIAEDRLVGAFIDHINEQGKIWSGLEFEMIVEAIDQAVANNDSMLDSALFLFVQEALSVELGIIQ